MGGGDFFRPDVEKSSAHYKREYEKRKSRKAALVPITPLQPSDRLRLARALRLIRTNAADSFLTAKPDGFDGLGERKDLKGGRTEKR